MKPVIAFLVLLLIVLTSACNKEQRLGKKYTKQLAKTWKWNGQSRYTAKQFNNAETIYKYVDTVISITAIDDITVEFMGIRFTRNNTASFTKSSNPVLTYTGEGLDKFLYFDYEQDTVKCLMAESRISSMQVLTLSGR